MIRVGINGYGTIGRRVADAVGLQEDMELVGVTKAKPDYRATMAIEKGIPVYVANSEHGAAFDKAKVPYAGALGDLLKLVDVVIDATPELGAEYKPVYEMAGVKALFQGGEEHELTGSSFVAQCNFDSVRGRNMTRVVSCNTTGLCRVLHALDEQFGIVKARAVLVRRAADPDEISKGPIDAIVPDPTTLPSHHGPDVQTVLNGPQDNDDGGQGPRHAHAPAQPDGHAQEPARPGSRRYRPCTTLRGPYSSPASRGSSRPHRS